MHRHQWVCSEHKNGVFATKKSFMVHLKNLHSTQLASSDWELSVLADMSERQMGQEVVTDCPLCSEKMSFVALEPHLAEHLESLSLFVLPPDEQTEQGQESIGSKEAEQGQPSSQDFQSSKHDSDSGHVSLDDIFPNPEFSIEDKDDEDDAEDTEDNADDGDFQVEPEWDEAVESKPRLEEDVDEEIPGFDASKTRQPPSYYDGPGHASDFNHLDHGLDPYDIYALYDSQLNKSSSKSIEPRPRPRIPGRKPLPPPRSKPKTRKSRVATAEDARRANIPAGYSLTYWDPEEEPIVLLGSVFDADSLGKWIYDWTQYAYGPSTPRVDLASDLWLLLIQLAGKNKRADDAIDRIRLEEERELVEDFLESGERLWVRFKKLLKICEEYMWKEAQAESSQKKPMQMGKNSGIAFVEGIFGRDRELDETEKLMSNIRLWSMRFDVACDEIIRNAPKRVASTEKQKDIDPSPADA